MPFKMPIFEGRVVKLRSSGMLLGKQKGDDAFGTTGQRLEI